MNLNCNTDLTYVNPDTSKTEGKYEKGSTAEIIKKGRKTGASQKIIGKGHCSAKDEARKKKKNPTHKL